MVSKAFLNVCLLKKKKTMPKEVVGYSLELYSWHYKLTLLLLLPNLKGNGLLVSRESRFLLVYVDTTQNAIQQLF